MKKASVTFGIFLTISTLIMGTLFLTKPTSLGEAFQIYIATLLLHACGTVLFLMAVKPFKPTLRRAYRFMAVGASMLLFGVVIIYGLAAAGSSERPEASVIIELPFLVMAIAFYIGVRAFAKLIGVVSPLINSKLVYAVSGVAGAIVGVIPGFFGGSYMFDVTVALLFFHLLLFIYSAILAYQVWQLASPFYKPAFGWFALFFGFTALHTTIGLFQSLPVMAWFEQGSTVIYIIAGIMLSVSAWQFNRLAYAEKSGIVHHKATGAKSSIDIVIFLAGFASNPSQVDSYLDTVRGITSSAGKRALDESEQKALAQVYINIEDYLIKNEPLRKFDRKDLRQMIDLQFKESVNEPAFWKQIPIDAPEGRAQAA